MTIKEASERYCIPIKILEEYESMELCGTVKRVMGAWQYDDQDIERLSMIMTLHDIGFSKEDIDEYMQLMLSGKNDEECIAMLNKRRKLTLDKIHVMEKQIDNIDYLRHEIQRAKETVRIMFRRMRRTDNGAYALEYLYERLHRFTSEHVDRYAAHRIML